MPWGRASGVLLVLAAAASAACLAEPPGHLPSSVRVLYSRAAQDSVGEHVDIYFLVARSGNELRLTGEEAAEIEPTFAPGLRRVFYVRESAGGREIWSMGLDGSDETVVLAADGEDFADPSVSPDETRIAFTRILPGGSRVEVAGIDGADPRTVVANGSWSQPAWSADGRSLAVTGEVGGVSRIHVVPVDGGQPRLLTRESRPESEPDWSPDGARIAFVGGESGAAEIMVADVATGAVTRLTDNDVEDAAPAWSPSGERIVFVSRRPDGRYNLWLMDADGGDVERLTEEDEAQAADPDWL